MEDGTAVGRESQACVEKGDLDGEEWETASDTSEIEHPADHPDSQPQPQPQPQPHNNLSQTSLDLHHRSPTNPTAHPNSSPSTFTRIHRPASLPKTQPSLHSTSNSSLRFSQTPLSPSPSSFFTPFARSFLYYALYSIV